MLTLVQANALRIPLADGTVQCCVTSPPYYGLRDYQVAGQLGLEATPDDYVAAMVAVFREVRRTLRDDGVLWLVIGDSYATQGGPNTSHKNTGQQSVLEGGAYALQSTKAPTGLKPKDLVGIPWRVAFALQADGWWLRSDVVWHKPNPMPESVTDRPTKAHEYVFLLTKSARYYWDAEAVKEPLAESTLADKRNSTGRHTHGKVSSKYFDVDSPDHTQPDKPSWYRAKVFVNSEVGRNIRTVWSIPTAPYSGAHFATYPPALVEPCIKAGSRVGDLILDPFVGSGTTLLVARKLGRNSVGLDLSYAYLHDQARARLGLDALDAWQNGGTVDGDCEPLDALPLFAQEAR